MVRPDGSTAAELVSKVMAKSGLTGVGFLTMAVGQEPERTLAPREDVFALASQASSPKDVVLAFHTAGQAEPPRRPLPARGTDESGGAEGGVASATVGAGEKALAERVAEQEKLIAQLKQIEREQQRIIDSQMRAGEGALSPRQRPLASALEVDKLQMALEEEKRQNAYNKQELEKLRAQKVSAFYLHSFDLIIRLLGRICKADASGRRGAAVAACPRQPVSRRQPGRNSRLQHERLRHLLMR